MIGGDLFFFWGDGVYRGICKYIHIYIHMIYMFVYMSNRIYLL